MRRNLSVLVVALVSAVLLSTQSPAADAYPTKPFEIVCAYTPGSSQDIIARVIADVGSKYFGQPMVVINKAGASGSIAAADVISSRPDGYKAFQIAQVFFATTIRTQKTPFDPSNLVPLANFVEMRLGMAVKGDSPFRTANDLIEYAKKNPGELKWAHVGRGITLHMSAMIIFKKAGAQTIDVPYKGTPECVAAMLGNHVDAASVVYGGVVDQVRAGQLRFLMFYTDKRYRDFPDVPTAVELGYPEAVLPTYVGLYIHKNTPDNIKKRLADVCKKIADDPDFKKRIENLGEVPKYGSPEFIREAIKKQEDIGIPILKEIGLYVGK